MNIQFKFYKDNSKEKWVCEIPIPCKKNGIRKYGKTKAEAKKKALAYINDPKNANIFISSDVDLYVEDILNAYLLQKKGKIEDSSLQRDERTARNQIIPYIGHYKITDLYDELLEEEFLFPLNQKYAASTVKKAIDLCNEFTRYAIHKKLIIANPFALMEKPKINKSNTEQSRALTANEIKLFQEQSQKTYKNGKKIYKYGDVICLCLYLGLRCGELCALRWSDVNFNENYVYISKTTTTEKVNGVRTTYVKHKTKGKINRKIQLSNNAVELLLKLKQQQNPTTYTYITTGTTDFMAADTLSQSYKSIAIAAGIQNPKSIHTLRHTFASQLFEKGVEVKIISELLGHSSVQTTYNMYIHTTSDQLLDAVNTLDNLKINKNL